MRNRNHHHPGVKAPTLGRRGRSAVAEARRKARRSDAATPPGTRPGSGGVRHAIMLGGSLGLLATVGLVLPHGDSGDAFRDWLLAGQVLRPLIAALWALVIVEGLWGLSLAPDAWSKRLGRLLLTSLFPPLRMVLASSTPSGWLWIPRVGWRPAGQETLEELEHTSALPMAVLTLLVLPVLAVELTSGDALDSRPRLALATHLTTSAIWLGFTVEFIWMMAAAPKRVSYCVRHWINLVIILVPLAAFLRVLNMFRFARMIRAGRLLRAYRLRGLSSRLLRLMMLFNLFERLQQRNPVKYCAALETKIADLEEELADLHARLAAARQRVPPPAPARSSPPTAATQTIGCELAEK